MKSWKTTLGGILTAVAVPFLEHPTYGVYAKALAALGTALIGFSARDNNVTSEAAGAKTVPPSAPPKG